MKDLEKTLSSLKIPQLETDPFEDVLRNRLTDKYFNLEQTYRKKYRIALAFSCLLFVFCLGMILYPKVGLSINDLTSAKKEIPDQFSAETNLPQDEINVCVNSILDDLKNSSIHNPYLADKIDPANYQQDKTYLIRKYTSQTQGSLMIVSEFKNSQRSSNKKISY